MFMTESKRRDFLKQVAALVAVSGSSSGLAAGQEGMRRGGPLGYRRIATEEAFITAEVARQYDRMMASGDADDRSKRNSARGSASSTEVSST